MMTATPVIGIDAVKSGAWVMAMEQGAYYKLCTLGVWIEFHAPTAVAQMYGARWSIDDWKCQHDAPALLKCAVTAKVDLWRVEIREVITTGWRDGSIGGPNGEQPSGNRWILWGTDKSSVECLPLGSTAPHFKFALFQKRQGHVEWENNQGHNFSLSLANVC